MIKYRFQPRKRFGQNFLKNDVIIQKIVSAINPKKHDHLVEIGPGLGALTAVLLPQATCFDAVEIDRDLIETLRPLFALHPQARLHAADALSFDFAALISSNCRIESKQLRIVGNLPYNITTPLLFHLLKFRAHIQDMHFMVQKEVGERLIAQPNSKIYGRLSIMMQYYFEIASLFNVGAEAFVPPPKIQSSFIRLIPLKTQADVAISEDTLAEVVRIAFNQRRKTIRNSLKSLVSEGDFEALQIGGHLRPEQLSLKQFVAISNQIGMHSKENKGEKNGN